MSPPAGGAIARLRLASIGTLFDTASGRDAGQLANTRQSLLDQLAANGGVLGAGALQRHTADDDVVGCEAELDAGQFHERPDEQAGAHQQHDRERDLRNRHRPAEHGGTRARRRAGAESRSRSHAQQRERRCKTEDEPGDERHRRRHEEDAPVQGHRAAGQQLARDVFGDGGQQELCRAGRDEQAQQRSGHREHHRFGQHVTNDAAPAGAERCARGDLAMTGDGARKIEIGDVHAGDQQQERDGAEQHQNRLPDAPAEYLAVSSPGEVRNPAFNEVGDGSQQIGAHSLELGLCGLGRAVAAEPPDHAVVHARIARGGAKRRQHVGAGNGDEVRRKHADDRVGTPTQRDAAAERVGAACKETPGQSLADERGIRSAGLVLVAREFTAGERSYAVDLEVVGRDAQAAHADRRLGGGQVPVRAEALCGDGFDHANAIADQREGEPALRRGRHRRVAVSGREHGNPIRLWIGHRLQQRGVHEAEDGGGGADPQRQRQQRRDGEAGCPAQRPPCIADVLKHRSNPVSARATGRFVPRVARECTRRAR